MYISPLYPIVTQIITIAAVISISAEVLFSMASTATEAPRSPLTEAKICKGHDINGN